MWIPETAEPGGQRDAFAVIYDSWRDLESANASLEAKITRLGTWTTSAAAGLVALHDLGVARQVIIAPTLLEKMCLVGLAVSMIVMAVAWAISAGPSLSRVIMTSDMDTVHRAVIVREKYEAYIELLSAYANQQTAELHLNQSLTRSLKTMQWILVLEIVLVGLMGLSPWVYTTAVQTFLCGA